MIPAEPELASLPSDGKTFAPSPTDSDPLTEDLALALLKRPDLLAPDLEQLAKNAALLKSRKVRLALAAHPRTPRRIALRLIR